MSITTEPETGLFGFSTEDDRADVVRQQSKFTEDALERHKRQGLELAVRARVIAMGVIAVMLAIIVPWPDVIYYLILDALFVVIGLLQRRVGRVGASYAELALLFCDLLLMTIIAAFPNPFSPVDVPLSFQYESEAFKFFFLILAMATLAYSWRTIIAVGTWTVALWAIAAAIIWYFNGDHSDISNNDVSQRKESGKSVIINRQRSTHQRALTWTVCALASLLSMPVSHPMTRP